MNAEPTMEKSINALRPYQDQCEFFSFEQDATDPHTINLIFHGRFIQGLSNHSVESVEPKFCEQQEVQLRLPESFPQSAPQIHWKSEIFHPNIAIGGTVNLADIGLIWDSEMTLPVVCERIWDVARLAYLEPDDPANSSAGNWFSRKLKIELPLDQRQFARKNSQMLSNIFRYQRKRKGDRRSSATAPRPVQTPNQGDDIVFID